MSTQLDDRISLAIDTVVRANRKANARARKRIIKVDMISETFRSRAIERVLAGQVGRNALYGGKVHDNYEYSATCDMVEVIIVPVVDGKPEGWDGVCKTGWPFKRPISDDYLVEDDRHKVFRFENHVAFIRARRVEAERANCGMDAYEVFGKVGDLEDAKFVFPMESWPESFASDGMSL